MEVALPGRHGFVHVRLRLARRTGAERAETAAGARSSVEPAPAGTTTGATGADSALLPAARASRPSARSTVTHRLARLIQVNRSSAWEIVKNEKKNENEEKYTRRRQKNTECALITEAGMRNDAGGRAINRSLCFPYENNFFSRPTSNARERTPRAVCLPISVRGSQVGRRRVINKYYSPIRGSGGGGRGRKSKGAPRNPGLGTSAGISLRSAPGGCMRLERHRVISWPAIRTQSCPVLLSL